MKKNIDKKVELLAPAGNLEKMKTAFQFGADAVYAGIPDFSLRVRINDFDLSKIEEATKYCHENGKKIYVTVNIFAHNKHLVKLPPYIKELKKIGVDALIVSDPGVMEAVRLVWSNAEIHLSTQANCTNASAAKFWFEHGVKRVILGREVTLEEIAEIHEQVPGLELEYFVHGAMCMAYSGRCFLSKELMDRSGNLGDCVQPCRWSFEQEGGKSVDIKAEGHEEVFEIVEEKHGSYILNSKDLCLLKHLKELMDAGVSSFKIEGRAKSVYYQAVVSGVYSRAIENIVEGKEGEKKELEYLYSELVTKLVHRGYTEGFLLGAKGEQNELASHNECEWEFCGVVKQGADNNKKEFSKHTILLKVHNSLKVGDEIEIVQPGYDIINTDVEKLWSQENGEEISEAHGGQEKKVLMKVPSEVPNWSVLRRRVN